MQYRNFLRVARKEFRYFFCGFAKLAEIMTKFERSI